MIFFKSSNIIFFMCFILLISILLQWILISIISLIRWSVLSFLLVLPAPNTVLKNPIPSMRYLWSGITAGLGLSWVQDPVVASQVVDGENIRAACPLIVQSFKHANNIFSNILKCEATKGMLYKLPHSLHGYQYIHISYIYISCRLNSIDTYR